MKFFGKKKCRRYHNDIGIVKVRGKMIEICLRGQLLTKENE